ncbi:MAG: VWA domain-containing protein [Sedimentisphaerales bacterium]|nr:VWA domain-containing protein [Sedimentisphaerales bacterium]
MEWLTPFTALYAALITVPLLLLLYFLKLKRHEHIVSSTLLWKRAIRDLQVNAPFQKLRHNILLLLQLLILFAVLFAIAWPVLSMKTGQGRRYVLLIDRSASMNTIDEASSGYSGRQSRLEKAKEQAKVFVESMRQKAVFSLKDDSEQTMVIAFDDHAKVMCNFTSNKQQLIYAIDSISAGHGKSSLSEAIVVARAFSQSPGDEADYLNQEEPAKLELFSDGRISDLLELSVAADEITYHSIGVDSSKNAGITSMQAMRSYENPDEIEIFASVFNYDGKPLETSLQLSVDSDVKAVRDISVPSSGLNSETKKEEPGKAAVNFSLSGIESGVLEVRLLYEDCLDCDNTAWSIISPPRKLSVLLVSANNPALESALKACPLAKLEIQPPEKFDSMDQTAFGFENPYDVIVLDNHTNEHLPKGRYIIFGQPPDNIDVAVSGQLENQVIIDWRQKHPILNYVNLINLFAAKCCKMSLPRDAETLAEFSETPALALVERNGSIFLLAGFDILETNWPFEPSFVLFCYNATGYLGLQVSQQQKNDLKVGEPIAVEGLSPGLEAKVTRSDGEKEDIQANPSGIIRFADTSHVGQYRLSISDGAERFYVVNLLDAHESDIKPVKELEISNSQTIAAQKETISRANIPLWPFLAGLALLLACIEWLVYNLKVRI